MEGQNLVPFDVEVLYFQNIGRPDLFGVSRLYLPRLDLKVSQLLWSVYLPTEINFPYFGGTVDKEKEAEGLRPLSSMVVGRRRILHQLSEAASDEVFQSGGKLSSDARTARVAKARQSAQYLMKSDFDESQGINETAYAQQVEREINFFGNVNRPGASGDTAQIRIKIPNAGQVYRFSKALVQENEPVTLEAYHVQGFLVKTIQGLIFLGAAVMLFRARRTAIRGLATARAAIGRHQTELAWFLTPAGQTVSLLAGGILLAFVSRFLCLAAFLAGIVSAIRWAKGSLKKGSPD